MSDEDNSGVIGIDYSGTKDISVLDFILKEVVSDLLSYIQYDKSGDFSPNYILAKRYMIEAAVLKIDRLYHSCENGENK